VGVADRAVRDFVVPWPELLGHMHADIGANSDAAGCDARAEPGGAGGLPRARDQARSHVSRDASERDRFARPIFAWDDERALHSVAKPRECPMQIGAVIVKVFMMQTADASLDARLEDGAADARSKAFPEARGTLPPLVRSITQCADAGTGGVLTALAYAGNALMV